MSAGQGPRKIAFLCVANRARSQLAAHMARAMAPRGVEIFSAGSQPRPVHPMTITVLREVGLDASGAVSQSVDSLPRDLDVVITLCDDEVCPAWLGDAERLHWPIPDPDAEDAEGNDEVTRFRLARGRIREQLGAYFRRLDDDSRFSFE